MLVIFACLTLIEIWSTLCSHEELEDAKRGIRTVSQSSGCGSQGETKTIKGMEILILFFNDTLVKCSFSNMYMLIDYHSVGQSYDDDQLLSKRRLCLWMGDALNGNYNGPRYGFSFDLSLKCFL